jgi:hypothetical protein
VHKHARVEDANRTRIILGARALKSNLVWNAETGQLLFSAWTTMLSTALASLLIINTGAFDRNWPVLDDVTRFGDTDLKFAHAEGFVLVLSATQYSTFLGDFPHMASTAQMDSA